jgi:hypothetical protein
MKHLKLECMDGRDVYAYVNHKGLFNSMQVLCPTCFEQIAPVSGLRVCYWCQLYVHYIHSRHNLSGCDRYYSSSAPPSCICDDCAQDET